MIVAINNDWRISTDEHQFVLQRRKAAKQSSKRSGEWTNVGYFGDLSHLLLVMTLRRILAIEGEFPAEALKLMAEALTEIQEDVRSVLGEVGRRGPGALTNVDLRAAE